MTAVRAGSVKISMMSADVDTRRPCGQSTDPRGDSPTNQRSNLCGAAALRCGLAGVGHFANEAWGIRPAEMLSPTGCGYERPGVAAECGTARSCRPESADFGYLRRRKRRLRCAISKLNSAIAGGLLSTWPNAVGGESLCKSGKSAKTQLQRARRCCSS
jgi:hypothetical protein